MKRKIIVSITILYAGACLGRAAGQSFITGLTPDGHLTWTNGTTNGIAIIQKSPDLGQGHWQPAFYDFATNIARTVPLPPTSGTNAFYRIVIRTAPEDPTLLLHLPFDNDFSQGVMLDISGFGHHGLRYRTDLWPSPTVGPDGSQAGEFHVYGVQPGFPYASGDYIAVGDTADLNNLTNGTISVWAHYKVGSYASSAIIDAAYQSVPGSWTLGRTFQMQTTFDVVNQTGSQIKTIFYPDTAPSGESGGWHHYCATFDGNTIQGYFDGIPCGTASQANYPALKLAGYFIAIGCRGHLGTPQVGDDAYPNNGWFAGSMDDVRIYKRTLSALEVQALAARPH